MATMATTVSFANGLSRIASDLWYRTVHVPARENPLYDFIADLRSNGFAKTSDYVTSLAIAVFITFLRHYATLYLFQVSHSVARCKRIHNSLSRSRKRAVWRRKTDKSSARVRGRQSSMQHRGPTIG